MKQKYKNRKYIRYLLEIPMTIELEDKSSLDVMLSNISLEGLCYKSKVPFEVNKTFSIKFHLLGPVLAAQAKAVWCKKVKDYFLIGVEFLNPKDAFKIMVIEQLYYVKKYKKEILEKQHRDLSDEQAAIEWINKFVDISSSI